MPISAVSVAQAYAMQQNGMQLIDIREADEWATGIAKHAKTINKAELEKNTCHYLVDFDQPVMLLCAGGKRSDACALALTALGYTAVHSVQGGTLAWQAANMPMQTYTATDFDLRYARQMVLPNICTWKKCQITQAKPPTIKQTMKNMMKSSCGLFCCDIP